MLRSSSITIGSSPVNVIFNFLSSSASTIITQFFKIATALSPGSNFWFLFFSAYFSQNKLNASIYITVNTLDYLRKGGRITPAVAILGGMMKIKPILQIQGEKLDTFSKTRTMSKATKIMMEAIKKDIDERLDPEGKGKNVHVCIAYTYDEQPALELKKELEAIYPDSTIICDPLSLSVSCHIGPHALAIAACKKII